MENLILSIMAEADYQITARMTMGGMTRDTFVNRRTSGGRKALLIIHPNGFAFLRSARGAAMWG